MTFAKLTQTDDSKPTFVNPQLVVQISQTAKGGSYLEFVGGDPDGGFLTVLETPKEVLALFGCGDER